MNLLLTGSYSYTKEQLNYLASLGYRITKIQDERVSVGPDVSHFEAVVCNGLFRYNDILKFKNLKFIQLTSAGTDSLQMEYIEKEGICLKTARGVYSVPIAEWVVLKILEICKKSRHFYNAQQQHMWLKERELCELTDKTVLLIGYGSIGMEIAKRLNVFVGKIIAFDSRSPNNEEMKWVDEIHKPEALDQELPKGDIVVLSLPLNNQTLKFLNDRRLAMMKNNAILVNVSRGAIIDEHALIEVLNANKFAGVALDVFEEEPLPADNPLWDFGRVLVTPHNAFVSEKNHQRMFNLISRNLFEYASLKHRETSGNLT